MKIRFYLLTSVIILGLIFSSGFMSENTIQNNESNIDTEFENRIIQPQEFPIPEELIGFETKTYGNLDADDFFWVEDYFVEDLGDGIGVVITPPAGDPILLPAGYDLNKVNETTIAYQMERYGEVVNQSYSYHTVIYNVPTGTQTLLDESYGEVDSIVTNEGILFDNNYASMARYYKLDGTVFEHDYSDMENSTHNAIVKDIYNDHLVIKYYNRDIDLSYGYYSVNINTNEITTIVDGLDDPEASRDEFNSDWMYICDEYLSTYTRCMRYEFSTKTSSTHIFENAEDVNVESDYWFYSVYNGWSISPAWNPYGQIFRIHDWSTNTTTYNTHDLDISVTGVTYTSGLVRDLAPGDYLEDAFIHNSTHALIVYNCDNTLSGILAIIELSTKSIKSSVEIFEISPWVYKDPVLNLYYLMANDDDPLQGTGNRYSMDTSLHITPEANVFTTMADLGIPYTSHTDPDQVFDFPDIDRTVLIAEGDDQGTILVFEGDSLVRSITLPDYVRDAVVDGYNIYLLLGSDIIKYDVTETLPGSLNLDATIYDQLYSLVGAYVEDGIKLSLHDNTLIFGVRNYTDGNIYHMGALSLADNSYSSSDYNFDSYPIRSGAYEDWHAVFTGYDGNLTIVNYNTGESASYDFWNLYEAYSGSVWEYSVWGSKIEFLPGFNLVNGELLVMLDMYDDNHDCSELLLLNASAGTISSPAKYGFDDARYPNYSGLTSNYNSSQILVSKPTPDGSDLYLLYFDQDMSWEMISMGSPENYYGYRNSLHITPNGFVAESIRSGIIIHTFSELVDSNAPVLSNIVHTDSPDQSMEIEIKVDVIDDYSAIPVVSLGYMYDGFDLVNVSMTSLDNVTWVYTIPAINSGTVAFLEYQITASDFSGNVKVSTLYSVVFPTTDPTDSTTTTSTTTTSEIETTPTGTNDTTEETGLSGIFSIVISVIPLVMISIILRRRK